MGTVRTGSPSYVRVSNFVGMFTEEEVAEWVVNRSAPEWVKEGIGWFMEQARKEADEQDESV